MSNEINSKILSGKEVAASVYKRLEESIISLSSRGVVPGLAAVLMGSDPASEVYVRMKTKRFAKMNLHSETFYIPSDLKEHDIEDLILRLNENQKYHGILVQLPLPKRINTDKILAAVSPEKMWMDFTRKILDVLLQVILDLSRVLPKESLKF